MNKKLYMRNYDGDIFTYSNEIKLHSNLTLDFEIVNGDIVTLKKDGLFKKNDS